MRHSSDAVTARGLAWRDRNADRRRALGCEGFASRAGRRGGRARRAPAAAPCRGRAARRGAAGRRARTGPGPRRSPISASRCSGSPVRAMPPRRRTSRTHSWRAPGRSPSRAARGREALDRQRVGGERGGSDGRDAGQGGQDLAGAVGQQLLDLVVDEGDVLAQGVKAREVAAHPRGAQARRLAAAAGSPASASTRTCGRVAQRPSARAVSDRTLGARPAKATAQASTARPVEVSSANARPCPFGAESPGASALSWSCSRWRSGLSASTSCRRCDTAARNASTAELARRLPGALASEPDQRRAVAIVGLEPTRPQLRSRRLRLRRREQPQRPRPAPLELGRPRAMQRARRLQREHRRPPPATIAPSRSTTGTRRRQRHRLTDQPLARRHPHPIQRLARIDRDDHPIHPNLSKQPSHRNDSLHR